MKHFTGIRYLFIFLVFTLLVSACDGDSSTTDAPSPPPASCQLQYVYDHVVNGGQVQEVVDTEANYNGTSQAQNMQFIATKSQTVTVSQSTLSIQQFQAQAELNGIAIVDDAVVHAQAEAIYDSVHEINNSVVMTKTATIGNQFNVVVGSWTWGYGNYGVYVQVASGHLYSQNCPGQFKDLGNVLTFTPIRVGWCVWVRGPNLFTDGGQSPCPTISSANSK